MAKKIKTRARKKAGVKKSGPSKNVVYLTVRALKRAVAKGTKNKKAEAIELLGYTVIEKDGWVVKEFADGHTEAISKLNKVKRAAVLVLD